MNYSYVTPTSQCGEFVQIRKWHLFLKMSYSYVSEFAKITVQINGGDIVGVGALDLHESKQQPCLYLC